MVEDLVTKVTQYIRDLENSYYKLILIIGASGSGKTKLLQEISKIVSAPVINVNLELSKKLLGVEENQRALKTKQLLDEIIELAADKLVLLDNTEMLFDTNLRQDPLDLLKKISRNKIVVASWNGDQSNKNIIYAIPSHPEYRSYCVDNSDFIVVRLRN